MREREKSDLNSMGVIVELEELYIRRPQGRQEGISWHPHCIQWWAGDRARGPPRIGRM